MSETLQCSRCGRKRPLGLFRGRHKVQYEGREMLCRTCQKDVWRAHKPKR